MDGNERIGGGGGNKRREMQNKREMWDMYVTCLGMGDAGGDQMMRNEWIALDGGFVSGLQASTIFNGKPQNIFGISIRGCGQ